MTRIRFTKASGAGNDFVIMDNRRGDLPADKARLARAVCSRHFGVGGDGLLLLETSDRADFRMEYYNADGSYGGMCGNGARCLARYASVRCVPEQSMKLECLGYIYSATIIGERIILAMKDPVDYRSSLVFNDVHPTDWSFINTGSPHVVGFLESLEGIDVDGVGRKLREDSRFSPEGTNVNFVQVMDANAIGLRTYERGVEAETLACGTGTVAAAIIAHLEKKLESPVRVKVKSGEVLEVAFTSEGKKISGVSLAGSARLLFDGEFSYDESADGIHADSTGR